MLFAIMITTIRYNAINQLVNCIITSVPQKCNNDSLSYTCRKSVPNLITSVQECPVQAPVFFPEEAGVCYNGSKPRSGVQ